MVTEVHLAKMHEMPGHLVRRFQQIAVAIFHAEVTRAGFDLTPVQYAALATVEANPDLDQITLAGLIAYDRTTIGGVVDRLVHKGLLTRQASETDRRSRVLKVTPEGGKTLRDVLPAVEAAQRTMLRGLSPDESETLLRLLRKAIDGTNDLSRAPLKAEQS
jgi:MarR family transcriptional regulator, temperature-dependent positive regulator of motility